MKKEKEIIYTTSGAKRKEKLFEDLNSEIEKYFHEYKFVPGDEFLEITASDIENLAKKITISRPYKTNQAKFLVLYIYCIAGLISLTYGIYFNDIKLLIQGDPVRIVFILGGIFMITLALFYFYLIKLRDKRIKLNQLYKEQIETLRDEIEMKKIKIIEGTESNRYNDRIGN